MGTSQATRQISQAGNKTDQPGRQQDRSARQATRQISQTGNKTDQPDRQQDRSARQATRQISQTGKVDQAGKDLLL